MRTGLLLAVTGWLLVVGCSGDKGQNQGACGRYVDHYNRLPCTQDQQIDFLLTCPDELADLECPDDISAYYQCLIDGTICVRDELNTTATENCKFVCNVASPTPTPRPSSTPRPTASPTSTASPSPSATKTPTATVTPSATPTVSPTRTPTASPTATPTRTPTASPTATP